MIFKMPYGYTVKIECSDPTLDLASHEEMDGVFYQVVWGKEKMPWVCNTRNQAYSLALGVQWGAYRMMEKLR